MEQKERSAKVEVVWETREAGPCGERFGSRRSALKVRDCWLSHERDYLSPWSYKGRTVSQWNKELKLPEASGHHATYKGDKRRHVLLRGGDMSYLMNETWRRHVLVV
jgi:hypothetical protein